MTVDVVMVLFNWTLLTLLTKHLISDVVFETTKRGNPVLVQGPYRYNISSRKLGPKLMWKCCRRMCGCKAAVMTLDGRIALRDKEHNH